MTMDNTAGVKHKGDAKTARIPIKVVAAKTLEKPDWIRVRAGGSPRFYEIKLIASSASGTRRFTIACRRWNCSRCPEGSAPTYSSTVLTRVAYARPQAPAKPQGRGRAPTDDQH